MSKFYDLDEMVDDATGVAVRFSKGGEAHELHQVAMPTLLALIKMQQKAESMASVADCDLVLAAVHEAFPTAAKEIDTLSPQRMGKLVQLITTGGMGDASGNASTASAEVSSAPSAATPAPTRKTPKGSGKGSKAAR